MTMMIALSLRCRRCSVLLTARVKAYCIATRLTHLVTLKQCIAAVFLKTRVAVSHRAVATVRLSLQQRNTDTSSP